jgi:hypothetical protein
MDRIALAAATVSLLAGCSPSHPPQARAPALAGRPAIRATVPSPLPLEGRLSAGRFQIIVSPTSRSDTWRLAQKTELKGQPMVWEHMDRLDTSADDYIFAQEHGPVRR